MAKRGSTEASLGNRNFRQLRILVQCCAIDRFHLKGDHLRSQKKISFVHTQQIQFLIGFALSQPDHYHTLLQPFVATKTSDRHSR
jgi:hypothetical protein